MVSIVRVFSVLVACLGTNLESRDSHIRNLLYGIANSKPRTVEQESSSTEEEDEQEEADGSSQSAYQLNKGLVPLADLFNAGTSKVRSDAFLFVPDFEY